MAFRFYNWQSSGQQPGRPYTSFSPNLILVRNEMRRRFGAVGGSGFNVRRTRASGADGPWSTHAFGAAWDGTITNDAKRAAAIVWLIAHHVALGIQAIHDYHGCRIWHVGRTSSKDPNAWWKPATPSAATGFGQPTSRWLHIETTPDRWGDTTPLAQRGIDGATAAPPTPLPTGKHPTLRQTAAFVPAVAEEVKLMQAGIGLTGPTDVDGWFGPGTKRRVIAYQRAHGMVADGIVGPQTWASIDQEAQS